MSHFLKFLACLFSLLGMGGAGLAWVVFVLAAIDPVSAKMADDGDPFGTPPSRISSVAGSGVSALVFGLCGWAGFRLLMSRPRLPGLSVR